MGGAAGVRGWLRAHPRQAEVLFALGVLLLALGPAHGGPDRIRQLSWGEVLLVLPAASACLAFRRNHPWRVLFATTALGLVGVALAQAPTTAYLPAIVALYGVSVRESVSRSVPAALASAFLPVAIILATRSAGALDPTPYALTGWSGVALMSGIAVRNQRAVLEAANERARLAEATREEEAQHRVMEERLRIARELHDVVAHHVSVINVQAGVAGHLMRSDPDAAVEAMAHVRQASQTVLREVPSLLGLLRTGEDELERAALPRLADADALVEQLRRGGAQVVWQTSGTPATLDPGTDLTAYRVLQEALTNATRHGTGRVFVRLEYTADELRLEVRNAAAAAEPAPGRHGLTGMRERVSAAGGTLTVGPEETGTWVVRAVLPVGPRVEVGRR